MGIIIDTVDYVETQEERKYVREIDKFESLSFIKNL